jgi:ATP/maltotriose-dependent transcriptional regulator MalT
MKNIDLVSRFVDSQASGQKYSNQSEDGYAEYTRLTPGTLKTSQSILKSVCSSAGKESMYFSLTQELEQTVRYANRTPLTPKLIQECIQTQHSTFCSIAATVAQIHDTVTKAQSKFEEYKAKFMSEPASRRDFTSLSMVAAGLSQSVQQPPVQQAGLMQPAFGMVKPNTASVGSFSNKRSFR